MVFYDFRCTRCSHTFESRQQVGTDIIECEECGDLAQRAYLTAPGVLMRPDGYNLKPDAPGYSKMPKTDREVNRWQLGSSRQRTSR